MNIIEKISIIKKRLFEKSNIILMLILMLISIILFSCLTIINFSIENKKAIENYDMTRSYYINTNNIDELNKIKKIDHISSVESYKYNHPYYFTDIDEFTTNNEKGAISLKPIIDSTEYEIKYGHNIEKDNEIVCSNIFYPHEYDTRIYSSLFLTGKDIINKKISIISKNEDNLNKKIDLTIVGTYKNKYMEESNTCYINKSTLDQIISKYNGIYETYDEYGNYTGTEYSEYTDYFIVIDSKNNINNVLDELLKMNIKAESMYVDNGILKILFTIPSFTSIIIIILTICILYNFISKKIHNRTQNIGILKTMGYNNKDITSLYYIEHIIIYIISTIIAIIIYLIGLNILKYTLLAEITYNNYILNIPYLYILINLIITIIIETIIIKLKLKKVFKQEIIKSLEM